MRTKFKITAKEQAACLAKLFKEKGMELTLENLNNLPLNSNEKNRKNGYTEIFVASMPTGMTLLYYDKKKRVLKEVSGEPGILPDMAFNMEMLEEILKKFGIIPDPEYKEPTAEELELFEQNLMEEEKRAEEMRKFMKSLRALSEKE